TPRACEGGRAARGSSHSAASWWEGTYWLLRKGGVGCGVVSCFRSTFPCFALFISKQAINKRNQEILIEIWKDAANPLRPALPGRARRAARRPLARSRASPWPRRMVFWDGRPTAEDGRGKGSRGGARGFGHAGRGGSRRGPGALAAREGPPL